MRTTLAVILALVLLPAALATTIPPASYDGCFRNVYHVPATCDGGVITSDTFDGCRTIMCETEGASLQILACDKPGQYSPSYYEVYNQFSTGSGLTLCVGPACISDNGFARATFPICQEENGASAAIAIQDWYPKGNDYVFLCNTEGMNPETTTFDWNFGDDSKLYDLLSSDVYHTFPGPGIYDVVCVANDGEHNEVAQLQVVVGAPEVPEFSTVLAGVTLIGGILGMVVLRRKK